MQKNIKEYQRIIHLLDNKLTNDLNLELKTALKQMMMDVEIKAQIAKLNSILQCLSRIYVITAMHTSLLKELEQLLEQIQ